MGGEIGARWKKLTPEQRAKYIKIAEEDMVRYRKEVSAYKELTIRRTLDGDDLSDDGSKAKKATKNQSSPRVDAQSSVLAELRQAQEARSGDISASRNLQSLVTDQQLNVSTLQDLTPSLIQQHLRSLNAQNTDGAAASSLLGLRGLSGGYADVLQREQDLLALQRLVGAGSAPISALLGNPSLSARIQQVEEELALQRRLDSVLGAPISPHLIQQLRSHQSRYAIPAPAGLNALLADQASLGYGGNTALSQLLLQQSGLLSGSAGPSLQGLQGHGSPTTQAANLGSVRSVELERLLRERQAKQQMEDAQSEN